MLDASEQPALAAGSSTSCWVEQFGGLCHKFHTAKDNDLLVGLGCLAAQLQRIAHKVGDGVEKCRLHVVVTENDGVLFSLETVDLIGNLSLDL